MHGWRTVKIRKWFRWIDYKFEDLKRGQLYKLINPNGTIIESCGLILKEAEACTKDAKPDNAPLDYMNYMVMSNHFKWWSLKQLFVRFLPCLSKKLKVGV